MTLDFVEIEQKDKIQTVSYYLFGIAIHQIYPKNVFERIFSILPKLFDKTRAINK